MMFQSQDSVGYKIDKLIRVPDSRQYNEFRPATVTRIFPHDYGFYFSSLNSKVKFVSTAGTVKEYFPFSNGIFSNKNDTLFLFGHDATNKLSIYSKPKTATEWTGISLKDVPNGLQYKVIDNQYIFHNGSQIWHISSDDNKNSFSINELKNAGLESVIIDDVCLFNNKVYILSGNGLFTKPLKTFFSYQK
jgi:hypothetical protein